MQAHTRAQPVRLLPPFPNEISYNIVRHMDLFEIVKFSRISRTCRRYVKEDKVASGLAFRHPARLAKRDRAQARAIDGAWADAYKKIYPDIVVCTDEASAALHESDSDESLGSEDSSGTFIPSDTEGSSDNDDRVSNSVTSASDNNSSLDDDLDSDYLPDSDDSDLDESCGGDDSITDDACDDDDLPTNSTVDGATTFSVARSIWDFVEINPLLVESFDVRGRMNPECLGVCLSLEDLQTWGGAKSHGSSKESWRDTLLTYPPVTRVHLKVMQLRSGMFSAASLSYNISTIFNTQGVTMGQIFERLLNWSGKLWLWPRWELWECEDGPCRHDQYGTSDDEVLEMLGVSDDENLMRAHLDDRCKTRASFERFLREDPDGYMYRKGA